MSLVVGSTSAYVNMVFGLVSTTCALAWLVMDLLHQKAVENQILP
jgi:hypothetical protein